MPKPKISRFVVLGDSLSDRDTLEKLWKYGLPMRLLSGLSWLSPDGRFTNGLVWDDALAAKLASELLIREQTAKRTGATFASTSADIADAILAKTSKLHHTEQSAYSLDDDQFVRFKQHEDFFRTFAEGGLTAHSYKGTLSTSPTRFVTRFLLSTLEAKRNLLFADDAKHQYGPIHKAQTLVLEESGVNDLITANRAPSDKEVDLLITARINNIREMIKHGYKQFMLFTLPDISKTPFYQNTGPVRQEQAKACIDRANQRLSIELASLRAEFDDETYRFELFDLHGLFNQVYDNPKAYGFDPKKLNEPYTESVDFRADKAHLHDKHGHLFWDILHPSGHMHEIAAERVLDKILKTFELLDVSEHEQSDKAQDIDETHLIDAFHIAYQQAWQRDQSQTGWFYRPQSNLKDSDMESLEQLFHHALADGGARSKQVMIELGWINQAGNCVSTLPTIQQAYVHYLHPNAKVMPG